MCADLVRAHVSVHLPGGLSGTLSSSIREEGGAMAAPPTVQHTIHCHQASISSLDIYLITIYDILVLSVREIGLGGG